MLKETILNMGWRIVMPLVKSYYRITKKCGFESKTYISYKTHLEGNNRLGRGTYAVGVNLGFGSYMAEEAYFFQTKIGRYTCIGPRAATICGKHPISTFVSVHPAFFSKNDKTGLRYTNEQLFDEFAYAEGAWNVSIGNDVWIGADAKIMQGVTIGDGAVVAAGAVVVKDVEPYAIVAGVPAKVMKYRFDEEQISWLEQLKWWNKPQEWIRANAGCFTDIEKLRRQSEKG